GPVAGGEDELPDEVVEARAEVADQVAEDEGELLERRLAQDVPAERVPARAGVVFGQDRVRLARGELGDEVVEGLAMLLGPAELREHAREVAAHRAGTFYGSAVPSRRASVTAPSRKAAAASASHEPISRVEVRRAIVPPRSP